MTDDQPAPADQPTPDTPANDAREDVAAGDDATPDPAPTEEGLPDELREHAKYINYQYFYGTVSAPGSTFGASFEGSMGRRGSVTGPMRPEDVQDALRRYLRPPGVFQKAREVLAERGMVVLCGPDGVGKYAGAIALLQKVASDKSPPTNLSPALSFSELARLKFGNAGGYIVRDHLHDAEASAVQQFEVHRLTTALRGQSYLVITTDLGVRPRGHLADLMVDWIAPGSTELFEACLPELPDHVQNGPEFDRLRRHVQTLICPRDVLKVIDLLKDGPQRALAELENSERDRVAAWFERGPSVEEVLSVAVLSFVEGTPEPTYEWLLDRLKAFYRDRVGVTGTNTDAMAAQNTMPQSRRRDHNDSLIAVGSQQQSNLESDAAGRTVSFVQPAMRELVLKQLHDRYGYELWAPVRDWLDELVARPPSPLHIRLGLGVAIYSTLSFHEVEQTLLDRWANGLAPERLAAATTLSWIGLDGRNASAALGITKRWAQNAGQRRAVTAASALGGPLGARYSSDALRWLWTLAMRSASIRQVACVALGILFATAAEDSDTTRRVLNFLRGRLRGSIASGESQRNRRATYDTVLSVLEARVPASGELVVSAVVRADESNATRLGLLWAELLLSGPHRARARSILLDALEALSGEPGSLPAVGRLGAAFRSVLSTGQWRDLDAGLRHEADRREDSGVPIAAVLAALLGRRSSNHHSLAVGRNR